MLWCLCFINHLKVDACSVEPPSKARFGESSFWGALRDLFSFAGDKFYLLLPREIKIFSTHQLVVLACALRILWISESIFQCLPSRERGKISQQKRGSWENHRLRSAGYCRRYVIVPRRVLIWFRNYHTGVSKNSGIPKMDGENNGKPY